MTSLKDECVYFCGPYEGYCGKAQYDHDAGIFHGEVVGTRDVVTFQGSAPSELRVAFRESVDDYLQYCEERKERPEKPFSGKFVAHIHPEIHRKISNLAELSGKSLNQFVADCLESVAAASPASQSPASQSPAPGSVRRGARAAKKRVATSDSGKKARKR